MFTKLLKSKTMHFSMWTPVLISVASSLGVPMTPEVAAAIMGVGAALFRLITKTAISDK